MGQNKEKSSVEEKVKKIREIPRTHKRGVILWDLKRLDQNHPIPRRTRRKVWVQKKLLNQQASFWQGDMVAQFLHSSCGWPEGSFQSPNESFPLIAVELSSPSFKTCNLISFHKPQVVRSSHEPGEPHNVLFSNLYKRSLKQTDYGDEIQRHCAVPQVRIQIQQILFTDYQLQRVPPVCWSVSVHSMP